MERLKRKCCLKKKMTKPGSTLERRVQAANQGWFPFQALHSHISRRSSQIAAECGRTWAKQCQISCSFPFHRHSQRSLKIITFPSMNPWWIIHYQVCLDAFPNSSKLYLCLRAVTTKLEMTRTNIESSARIISIKSVFSELLSDKCTTIDFRSCMNPNQWLFW